MPPGAQWGCHLAEQITRPIPPETWAPRPPHRVDVENKYTTSETCQLADVIIYSLASISSSKSSLGSPEPLTRRAPACSGRWWSSSKSSL